MALASTAVELYAGFGVKGAALPAGRGAPSTNPMISGGPASVMTSSAERTSAEAEGGRLLLHREVAAGAPSVRGGQSNPAATSRCRLSVGGAGGGSRGVAAY